MIEKLTILYGKEKSEEIYIRIKKLIEEISNEDFKKNTINNTIGNWVTEKDIILITYGDQIQEEGKYSLKILNEFLHKYLKGVISIIHILPFYPYSSDDGFSVIDYFNVNPDLGDWSHIEEISKSFDLMFDAVINHISAESDWFKSYLKGERKYRNYFIEMKLGTDVSTVTRPRAVPLLSQFETSEGEKYIWTTFSDDQIDLNYKNESVLLKIIELLLFYIKKGAKLLRLDAIGYLWKELGTSCIHLKETHLVIQLFRDIFEIVAPDTLIITETNVPHEDNISYYGDGYNEAHMVYQFPLPPLVLHAMHTGSAKYLLSWADSLQMYSDKTTFFNFLASHDGIGVMPAKGILPEEEIGKMVKKIQEHGGYVSCKDNGDGTESVYELNVNYFDAIADNDEDEEIKIQKFLCSQSILLTLIGIPGIYAHSLFGSRNAYEEVGKTGKYRSINRKKLVRKLLEEEIEDTDHLRHKIFYSYKKLIEKRIKHKAFNPTAPQQVIYGNDNVFAIMRKSVDDSEKILCLHNVSGEIQMMDIEPDKYQLSCIEMEDILSGSKWKENNGKLTIEIDSYEFLWLKIINAV